jgi:NAD(P)-dependent dehydrogenase (short-subunit alcohol dehydrogenase family)
MFGGSLSGFNLGGKAAVVTGAASGIGQAIARSLAANGARVWVLDIDVAAGRSTAEEITEAGGRADALPCDVADPESVHRAFAAIASQSPIDVLINSAGIAHIGTIATTTIQDFEHIFRVNVQGTYLCMQAAIATMIGQSGGVILNLASVAAVAGIPDRFAYSMSKGAVRAMTFSVAKDFLDKNIRCNCITPARVHTPFVDGYLKRNYPGKESEMLAVLAQTQPVGRMARPEEVAGLAVYLCSDLASFLTGADIPFDGGVLNLRG